MNRTILFFFPVLLFAILNSYGQQTATLKGRILDESNNPIENVHVFAEDGTPYTFSDNRGEFQLSLAPDREVRIRFQHITYRDTFIRVHLEAGESKRLTMKLMIRGEMLRTLDVRARYDDGYVRIDPRLNYKIPTISGGVESLIKLLPGASSTNELSSQYNVRGGNYDENLVYVNDIEIYRPFLMRNAQQEGLSFVNLDLTRSVKFSAGGFEAKYGDKMSSVLDVEYKKPTGYGGAASASLLGATAYAEGNVNDKFTFLAGIRFKSNAYILKSMESKGDYKPRFFDTQLLLTWNPVKKLEISLLGNFSNNSYIQIPEDRETNFGPIGAAKRLTIYFDGQEVDKYETYLGGLTFNYKPDHRNQLKFIISSYLARESETYDITSQYWVKDIEADMGNKDNDMIKEVSVSAVGTFHNHARNNLTAIVSAADLRGEHRLFRNSLSWGLKVQNEVIRDHIKEWTMVDSTGYTLPNPSTVPGDSVPLDDPSRILGFGEGRYLYSVNDLNTLRISGFIQDTWNIDGDSATRFKLNAGVRFNVWTYNKELLISPRINFIYKPRWERDWLFQVKTGIYYQPPFYREMRNKEGVLNRDIKAPRSFQIVASTEHNFRMWRRPFKFTAEVYYKYMDRLISYTVDNVKIIYSGVNDAKGYATGIDFKLSGEFIPDLESWISISLMKTEEDILNDYDEVNDVEPGYIPRPTDQRFAINIFFQDHIPGVTQLRVHLNFVFSSGLPFSAPNAERYKVNYVSVIDGKTYTNRTPWYRRVDVGFSYMFLEQGRDRMKHKNKGLRAIKNLGVYFEVFNLLGTKNVSSHTWVNALGGSMIPVPNYLTDRLLNLKFSIEI